MHSKQSEERRHLIEKNPSPSMYNDEKKPENPLIPLDKKVSAVMAKIFGGIAVIMTYMWSKKEDADEKYLGGLNWNDKVFNWHPVLMVTGLLFFFGFGITSFKNVGTSKPINKALHVICYVGAIVCFSVGLKAVWKSHDENDNGYIANLYSIHSWLGLATVALFAQNFLLGLYHYLNPAMDLESKVAYMQKHVFFGMFTIVAAAIAIETGIMEKNTFLGCNYSVDEKDTNPAEHYKDIPEGCRLSNGIGIVTLVTLMFILYTIWPMKAPSSRGGLLDSV